MVGRVFKAKLVILDCRDMHLGQDILRAQHCWNHCGLHPQNLENLAEHRKLWWFQQELVHKFKQAVQQRELAGPNITGPLRLVFYCEGGRDRSVGLAELTAKVLRNQGWKGEISHLCEARWRRCPKTSFNQRICDVCAGKDAPWADRRKLAEERFAAAWAPHARGDYDR